MNNAGLKRNALFCRIVALLFLIMMVRYRTIYVLMTDASSNIYVILVVAIFYLLNIASMVGMFLPRQWGFISCYFSIPLSTFLFGVSYFSFISDWLPTRAMIYVVPFLNAALLVLVVHLQVRRGRL